jgi:hypothetical protein
LQLIHRRIDFGSRLDSFIGKGIRRHARSPP